MPATPGRRRALPDPGWHHGQEARGVGVSALRPLRHPRGAAAVRPQGRAGRRQGACSGPGDLRRTRRKVQPGTASRIPWRSGAARVGRTTPASRSRSRPCGCSGSWTRPSGRGSSPGRRVPCSEPGATAPGRSRTCSATASASSLGKWPPTWYDASAVLEALAPYPSVWMGRNASAEDEAEHRGDRASPRDHVRCRRDGHAGVLLQGLRGLLVRAEEETVALGHRQSLRAAAGSLSAAMPRWREEEHVVGT